MHRASVAQQIRSLTREIQRVCGSRQRFARPRANGSTDQIGVCNGRRQSLSTTLEEPRHGSAALIPEAMAPCARASVAQQIVASPAKYSVSAARASVSRARAQTGL
jgi:hypothetical protein